MKNLSIILACILAVMVSCTKSKEVHPEIGDGNDEIVTVGVKDVHVEYARTDHAELSKVVFHYCPTDANGNAQQFEAAEMTKKETFFELTLDDLLSDTLYWYYYELFPNGGNAFTTNQKTFHTQAFEQPEPPTPPTPPSGVPEGAINGLFTINENGDKVYFSQGNLQYRASTNTWRFAEHQWDFVGDDTYGTVYENGVKCNNELISSTYNGWIDLFGWGTSGWNNGNKYYQPYDWQRSEDESQGYGYGPTDGSNYHIDLTGNYAKADWGNNAVINGGNTGGLWRSLTSDEWDYLILTRNTNSNIHYVQAIVNNHKGIVLLPDDWDMSNYSFNNPDQPSAGFSSNVIGLEQWRTIEQGGAVFLPLSGSRGDTWVGFIDEFAYYWLSSSNPQNSNGYADIIAFMDYGVGTGASGKCSGHSVRLVQDAN